MSRQVCDMDICAGCANLRPSRAIPQGPLVTWEMDCECSEGFPLTGFSVPANAYSECPKYVRINLNP